MNNREMIVEAEKDLEAALRLLENAQLRIGAAARIAWTVEEDVQANGDLPYYSRDEHLLPLLKAQEVASDLHFYARDLISRLRSVNPITAATTAKE